MKKRILAFFLAGVMTFTMVPGEVSAASVNDGASAVSEAESSEEPAEAGIVQQEKKDLDEPADLKPVEELQEDILKNTKFETGGALHPEAYQIDAKETEALGIPTIQELRRKGTNGISSDKVPNYGSQKYDSSWDIYSSNYLYNRLSSKEKRLWDDMNDICNDYLVNNVDTTVIQGQKYMIPPLDYTEYGLSRGQMENVFIMFIYSNPQYYFVEWYGEEYYQYYENGPKIYTGIIYLGCYSAFDKGSTRKSETAKLKRQIDAVEAQIAKGKNEQQKAQIAHDWIIKNVRYDYGYKIGYPETAQNPYHQSAYSVFCTDYTVCAGYTKAFEMLMNGAGVDTIGVTSTGHAWNIVSINDSWYHVDCTWDDNLIETADVSLDKCYIYFNRSTGMITGKLDQGGMHKMESFYTGKVPKCTLDSGATVSSPGSCKNPTVKTAKPQLSQKLSGSKVKITLSTTTNGAEIYYTTDGKNPSSSFSKSSRYTGAFTVKPNTTVKAIAVCDTKKDSDILTVKVSGKTYTVKFDTKGGNKISSKKVSENTALQKPSNPKRKNYSFEGWYTDKNCKKKYDFKKKVTKNFTLYAKWKKVTVKTPSIQKLSNLSGKKMKVQIKGVSGAKGYEIRYSTNSKMKSSKYTTVTSKSKTISKMKKNKTYYVQVRAYKKDSAGKKVNSSWSKTKTIKIKK